MDIKRFESISCALKGRGFQSLDYALEDGLWSWVASIGANYPKIAVWYGRFLEDSKRNIIWVGFQGEKNQVYKLRNNYASQGGTFSQKRFVDYENFDPLESMKGLVCEKDQCFYYIGLYDFDDQINFDELASKTLDDLLSTSEICSILKDSNLSETDRDAIVKARVGQGKFRCKLDEFWGGKCAVTGCSTRSVLRASHIKPWRDCNNQDRLDVFNGLLLTANIDALFDAGLISFEDNGSIIVSKNLSINDITKLGLKGLHISKPLETAHMSYMAIHRKQLA